MIEAITYLPSDSLSVEEIYERARKTETLQTFMAEGQLYGLSSAGANHLVFESHVLDIQRKRRNATKNPGTWSTC